MEVRSEDYLPFVLFEWYILRVHCTLCKWGLEDFCKVWPAEHMQHEDTHGVMHHHIHDKFLGADKRATYLVKSLSQNNQHLIFKIVCGNESTLLVQSQNGLVDVDTRPDHFTRALRLVLYVDMYVTNKEEFGVFWSSLGKVPRKDCDSPEDMYRLYRKYNHDPIAFFELLSQRARRHFYDVLLLHGITDPY